MLFASPHKTIAGKTSLFMDSLRIVASVVVFGVHGYSQWNPLNKASLAEKDWGHLAVIVFFTLSGYVIAYTTTSNNRGPLQYSQARLSRLCSVVIPALIITGVIENIVKVADPQLLLHYHRGISWPRYLLTFSFLNEVWFLSASPPINGPLWSLSYEFWYYAIFGLFFFSPKGWKGKVLPLIACLIAGPKILLLMPIWLLGFLAYRMPNPIKSTSLQWFLVVIFFGVALMLLQIMPALPYRLGQRPLYFSGQFITDIVIGVFMALALWALPNFAASSVDMKSKMVNAIRKFADLTFPLYVLHDPLLVLFRSVWKTQYYNNIQMVIAMLFAFAISMFLGYLMEKNRHHWINLFKTSLAFGKAYYLKQIVK